MRKLNVFNFLSLNGFYRGPDGDISWHKHGAEEGEYSKESLQGGSILLFGRVTYDMMKSYWPTPMAMEDNPDVANGMNKAEKIVFSDTLKTADWENTSIISGNIIEAIKKLKQTPGKNMTLLGSGSILTQFAEAGLIDQYQFMIDPVALGEGVPAFCHMKGKLDLELVDSRIFKSGTVLLTYKPLK
jgi:dihydrofolate reductase